MSNKVLFLDYDGVVNIAMWNERGTRCSFNFPKDNKVNHFQAVQWVSEFCEKYGYDVVVTSTWRKYPEWESCLRGGGLRDSVRILGSTALPTKDRAEEISEYLSDHPETETYLVFDDKESLAESIHRDRLVLCQKERGFGETEYGLAVAAHLINCKKEK